MSKFLRIALFLVLAVTAAKSQTVIPVSGDITASTTWTNDKIYLINGNTYVNPPAVLTIQAGTLIQATNAAALVIMRGAQIQAIGTPTQPIIFTSNKAPGQRARGDWGGLILCGRATNNDPSGEKQSEGGIDPVKGLYGGGLNPDDNDNSGTLQYVRSEFAGYAFQPNSEINGLTFGSVGRGTTVDHVQVSYANDDSYEWFGGTVNCKYLIAIRGIDDEFDTDNGYSGKCQFLVSMRDSAIADISGSNGFESDNDANGSVNQPFTAARFSNVSIFGPLVNANTQINSLYRRGAHLRRSTKLNIFNTLIAGFPTGIKFESANTGSYFTSGQMLIRNTILAGMTANFDTTGITNNMMLPTFLAGGNSTLPNSTDLMAVRPYDYTNPDYRLQAGSPALTGASFSATPLQDPFFTPTTYRGAFDDTHNWTECWAEFNPVNAVYSAPIDYSFSVAISAANTVICAGETAAISAPAGYASYLWSNGATTQSINATTAGNYTCTVKDARGCAATSNSIAITVNAAPTASIAGTTTICAGSSTTLSATGGASYVWSNNSIGSSITATGAGMYMVTATDVNGCTATASTTVNVNANPFIAFSGATAFCPGSSATITAAGAASYAWNTGAVTAAINVTTPATYSVTATDANGCSSTANIAVTEFSAPMVGIASSTPFTFCTPGSATVTASGGTSYAWSNGATTASVNLTASGNYTCTVTDANGCSDMTPAVTIVANAPTAFNIATNGTTTFCTGNSVDLSIPVAGNYVWSDGSTSQSLNVTATGTYTATLTDLNGCTSTSNNAITTNVSNAPQPTVNTAGATTFCDGGSVTLTSSLGASYLWNTGETTQSINATTTGTYFVYVTNANACDGTGFSSQTAVTANANPMVEAMAPSTILCGPATVDIMAMGATDYAWSTGATTSTITVNAANTYTVTGTTNGCTATASFTTTAGVVPTAGFTYTNDGQIYHFTSTSTNAANVAWSFGDSTFALSPNPAHVFVANGTYTVILRATSADGCESLTVQTITVTATGVEAFASIHGINLYPNPTADNATLEMNLASATEVAVKVIDQAGRVVSSTQRQLSAGVQQVALNTAELTSGVYFVQILADGGVKTLRLTVLH